ncbi:MAG TPA: alanine racemase [Acidobacteria bacterium]|jgi:alanine racemase|nr:alanine racemase [Acidobacteriota bacterium]MDP6372258.1 alanine racemase [Vicinamibacterales bacterium]HAK56703.1 alanine racemase [Acidobacteriota bacterium]|tara:strand:- start:3339 stop:4589 length:1251 start_codon:yes stop_codon:yes gene_type:complete
MAPKKLSQPTTPKAPGRRTFLTAMAATAAAPALRPLDVAAQTSARSDSAVHSSFDPWVEVHADNLRHNIEVISQRVKGRPIMAVIKNNAYGLGIANAGRILDPLDAVEGMAVVKLNEAVALRDAGIRKPVLLMGPFDEANLEEMVARDIMPMVYTPIGDALERVAAKLQKTIPIHVCLDTGMGRVGVPARDAAPLVRDLAGRAGVRIEGLQTTLSEDAELDPMQIERLQEVGSTLRAEGVDIGRLHAASSFGLFEHPDAFLDMVRVGMAIYGVYSEPPFRELGVLDLRPAVAMRAKVAYVKQLRRGETAGYGRAYEAENDVWIATLPIGHVDGLPRAAAQGGRLTIGGRRYPIIAAISASHTMVEIGAEGRVQIGDEVTVFDWEDGSRPEDLAAEFNGSVYDLTMHLGPLMARRMV